MCQWVVLCSFYTFPVNQCFEILSQDSDFSVFFLLVFNKKYNIIHPISPYPLPNNHSYRNLLAIGRMITTIICFLIIFCSYRWYQPKPYWPTPRGYQACWPRCFALFRSSAPSCWRWRPAECPGYIATTFSSTPCGPWLWTSSIGRRLWYLLQEILTPFTRLVETYIN